MDSASFLTRTATGGTARTIKFPATRRVGVLLTTDFAPALSFAIYGTNAAGFPQSPHRMIPNHGVVPGA